mgnify:CR=1 FL=1
MAVVKIREEIPIKLNKDGVYLVGGTRVTLDTIVRAHKRGRSAETIARQYPALQLADVYFVIGYYLHNPATVEQYLEKRAQLAKQVRKLNETRFPQKGVRARLAARTQSRK